MSRVFCCLLNGIERCTAAGAHGAAGGDGQGQHALVVRGHDDLDGNLLTVGERIHEAAIVDGSLAKNPERISQVELGRGPLLGHASEPAVDGEHAGAEVSDVQAPLWEAGGPRTITLGNVTFPASQKKEP